MSVALMQPLALDLQLPWVEDQQQEEKFKKTLERLLIPLIFLFLVLPFLPVYELEYEPEEPELVTTVILKPIEVTPFEPEKPKEQPKPKVKPKDVPKNDFASPTLKTRLKEKPKIEVEKSVEKSQGLNELSSQLTALRGTLDIARLQSKNVTSSKKGVAVVSTKEFLGKDGAARRSDGIEISDEMLSGESAGLGSYTSSSVNGTGLGKAFESSLAAHRSAKKGERDIESVRRTLESVKSRMASEYHVARRDHPDLEGKFVFEIIIEPDGLISQAKLVTSELGVARLEQSILRNIRSLNFGAKEDVVRTRIKYTFNFFPS